MDFAAFTARMKMVVRMLKIGIGLQVIAVIVDINQLRVLYALQAQTGNADAIDVLTPQADISDTLMSFMGYLQVALLVLTAVLFLSWVHQANKNARDFGAKDMVFTPGWAVGWYFVPIANLWKPFQAMSEIFRASGNVENWKDEPNPDLLGYWWFFYLADNIVARIVVRVVQNTETIGAIIGGTYLQIFSDLLTIPSYWFAMKLLRAIQTRQEVHAQKVPVIPPAVVEA